MAALKNTEAVVATPREGKFNKNAARRVRVAGKIPAVIYGAGKETVAVAVRAARKSVNVALRAVI